MSAAKTHAETLINENGVGGFRSVSASPQPRARSNDANDLDAISCLLQILVSIL